MVPERWAAADNVREADRLKMERVQATFAAIQASLAQGQAVVFPTDTVPALAALPSHYAEIYRLKSRSRSKPLILMGGSLAQLQPYIAGWHPAWAGVAAQAWPGAVTLVLPASTQVPPDLVAADGSIGLRWTAHPEAQALLLQIGALVTTSVNRSGQPALTTAATIRAEFPNLAILDAPFPPPAPPSTVLRWTEAGWQILRQGDWQLPDVS